MTLVAVGLRFFAKATLRKQMRPDDWTILIATVNQTRIPQGHTAADPSISGCNSWILRGLHDRSSLSLALLAQSQTDLSPAASIGKYGVHLWNISTAHVQSDLFIICSYFLNWLAAVIWCFAKSSFFLIYLDIFGPVRWQRYTIYFELTVNILFYIATTIPTFYYTTPAPGESWQESFLSERYTGNFNTMMPIVVGSFIIDMYIFVLPMMFVSPLQMSLRKKIGVLSVFATGLLACVASSLRIYYTDLLSHNTDDFTYYNVRILLMSMLEMCAGITACCMPSLVLLYRKRGQGRAATGSPPLHRVPRAKMHTDYDSSSAALAMSPYRKSAYTTIDDMPECDQRRFRGFRPVETTIEGGSPGVVAADGQIELKYGLTQNTVPREVV
ncbi:hypothetical protein BJY04DRAFT_212687 [Aspergillus karnatakaensis]|uniref:uncharacterized protein n=1 Tax=Aspergillus karnatakaensis TaxID=1810916 RepID=UPI003CCDB31D